MRLYSLLYSACGVIYTLDFYCAIQTIRCPQTLYSHEALNGYFYILMACEKAGTLSFLGYPVTLLFITKVLHISVQFV